VVWRLHLRDFSTYETFTAPTWAEVETVLRRLDGFRHDDASLDDASQDDVVEDTAEARLVVGGGEDGRVVVALQRAGTTYPRHLVDPTHDEALLTQTVGGHVPLDLALRAAHYFYLHRHADPALRWEAPAFEEQT
jgi:hypothetical protein